MSTIVIPYKPREAFKPYHDTDKRFCVSVCHRRAGKTVARINKLIRKAVECTLPNPRYGYLSPFYVQSKDIAWLYLKHYCAPLIEHGAKVNETELSITLPHNNAIIRLYGAENAERMRGVYWDGVVVDEAQGIAKRVLTQIIMPALADREGWLDVSGTPKGWSNMLGELVKVANNSADWFLQILPASTSGIIPAKELARQKEMMSENEYLQEFECSFDAAIEGAVYGKQISEMYLGGRIVDGLYDNTLEVHTAWDLGFDDATAIWFWQKAMNEVRLIDYYETNGQDIEHYCNLLKSKPYHYGQHYVPHDAANKLLAAGGRSIVQQAYGHGVKMRVVAATSQMNGIEALRKVLGITWADPITCEAGLEALRMYQFQWDDDKKTFRSTPRHDFASHAADAAEIIGQVWRDVVQSETEEKPRFLSDMTANDVFWPQNERKQTEQRY